MTDREVAERAARAAAAEALARFGGALDVAYKSSQADPVTDADRAAQEAALAVLRAQRPRDGVEAEEGRGSAPDAGAQRTWVVDALDGTANFLSGVPHWCSAVALRDGGGAAVAAAVVDAVRGEAFSAARGEPPAGPSPGLGVRTGRPLARAVVATFLRPDKLDAARAGAAFGRLVAATGGPRVTGSGTLELAWVAAGRLDAWAQPAPDPWDWLPGALLVEAAGGTTRVVAGDPPWCVAGSGPVVEELARVLAGV